jgi:hypothetical protein
VVMTPTASVMGRDTGDGHNESQGIISSRRHINSEGGQTLVVKERTWPIYLTDMGITPQAEDRQWASLHSQWSNMGRSRKLIMYADYIGQHGSARIVDLVGKRLLGDTPKHMPWPPTNLCHNSICKGKVSLQVPRGLVNPERQFIGSGESGQGQCLAWWPLQGVMLENLAIGKEGDTARHPPLPLASYCTCQQLTITKLSQATFQK